MKLFDRFNIQTYFLSLDRIYWEENEKYKKGKIDSWIIKSR